MSKLMKQIQEIQEQFDNLFEVDGDGLGQPAVDVPPSQNKIKKDRKTKDGKVELVSVEDELFPYEGNKREQYRQKIIATINDMIQGKATLEDLLQIVRQKKAPLKEAVEILEGMINEVSDKTAQGALDAAQQRYNRKGYEASMKLFRGDSKGAIEDGNKAQDEYNKHLGLQLKRAKRLGKKLVQDKNDHDSFKIGEAIELMEEIINEISDKKVETALDKAGDKVVLSTMGVFPPEKKYVEQYKKLRELADKRAKKHGEKVKQDPDTGWHKHVKGVMEILEKHVFPKLAVEQGNAKYLEADKKKNEAVRLSKKAFDKLNKKIKELEGKGIDTDVDIESHVTYGNGPKKEYQQALKTANDLHDKAREADREFTKADNNQRKLRIEGNKGVIKREFEPVPTKKGDNFNFKKVLVKNEALEEAIKLMEEVINEVSVGKLAKAVENNAPKRKEVAKKSEENAKKAWASYDKLSQEYPEDEPALYNAATELGKVAYKDEQRKEHIEDLEKLNLPKDSKVSANKLFKAADKSYDKRADEYDKLLDSGESRGKSYKETKESRPAKRYTRAARIGFAEPVKSRAYESLEEAIEVLEDLRSKIQAQPKEKRADLEAKFAKMKQKEGKSMFDRHKEMRKHMTKQEKGQEKTEERTEKALRNYIAARRDYMDNTPSMYEFESLEEAIQLLSELFDRPDLLDDIDTTLGSPVKKTFKKKIKK